MSNEFIGIKGVYVYQILAWLNFLVADVRDGLGPYLGVFLKAHDFSESEIGLITSLSALSALLLGIPLGAWVDKTRYKCLMIGICIVVIMFASLSILFFYSFLWVLLTQIFIALSGVFLTPAFAAITLGIVGHKYYATQTSINEAYKHAGTVFGAALSFIVALYYGVSSIFIITFFMGALSLCVLLRIRESDINHSVACGYNKHTKPIPLKEILLNKSILLMGILMFCFHLSNAHMLPLLSQRAYDLRVDTTGAYAAATIFIAQGTMIGVALLCGKMLTYFKGDKIYFWLMLISFLGLMIRGVIAANSEGMVAMVVVQLLDGVGAGITGVILPIMIATLLRDSGHLNAGFAFVMTCGGVGGALSAVVAGFIAQALSYFYAYCFLALIAFIGLGLWLLGSRLLLCGFRKD